MIKIFNGSNEEVENQLSEFIEREDVRVTVIHYSTSPFVGYVVHSALVEYTLVGVPKADGISEGPVDGIVHANHFWKEEEVEPATIVVPSSVENIEIKLTLPPDDTLKNLQVHDKALSTEEVEGKYEASKWTYDSIANKVWQNKKKYVAEHGKYPNTLTVNRLGEKLLIEAIKESRTLVAGPLPPISELVYIAMGLHLSIIEDPLHPATVPFVGVAHIE